MWLFWFARALVLITDWRAYGINPLFQPSIESFLRFLPEVADEVRSDHCLNICGEPSATGIQIEAFIRKVNLYSCVNELAQISPILKVPRASIYFMDHHATRFPASQGLDHLVKKRTPALRCGLLFFEPAING